MKLIAQKREKKEEKKFTDILGNIYGHNKENISIKFNSADFNKIYETAGTSTSITIEVDGKDHDVIIKEVQIDPRKDVIHHVDFYEFTKGEKMETKVSLKFINEAPAEKKGLILNTAKTELEINVLPKDLPEEIEVDLSTLTDEDSIIRVKDLKLPTGVEVINDPEEVIVSVVKQEESTEE